MAGKKFYKIMISYNKSKSFFELYAFLFISGCCILLNNIIFKSSDYNLYFGLLFTIILLIPFIINNEKLIYFLLILSVMTGFFDRLIFYLAGQQNITRDYIRFIIEFFILINAGLIIYKRNLVVNSRLKKIDWMILFYIKNP